MNAVSAAGPGVSQKSNGTGFSLAARHRVWITLGAVAGAALIALLVVNGFHYYSLPLAQRLRSPEHAALKPSGSIGRTLGMLGFAMFAIMYLYPLRKKWRWLAQWGTTRHWLDYHIVLGILAPAVIAFHASFKFNGIAGVAFWIMVAVALSGIVGRYLYSSVPRRLDEAEMSLEEMQQASRELGGQLEDQRLLPREELNALFALPPKEAVQAMPVWKALLVLIGLNLRRTLLVARLRRKALRQGVSRADLNRALAIAKKQAALARDILFLTKTHQLFALWHVVHRPFSYSFAVLVLLHVTVVMVMGYFWS